VRARHAITVAILAALATVALWWLFPRDRQTGEAPAPLQAHASTEIERGRELVLLGDCQGCHTAQGGRAFAGRRGIPTPFGTFFAPNITPDDATGIGSWTEADFWHALHNGYARDGKPLYPTFPYTNYTQISRRDVDAMYAYLRTIPAVRQPNRAHELGFPYSQRWLLVAWRALYFRPGVYKSDPQHSAAWNRGAYLTRGLAHCSACHEARNSLGAIQSRDNPAGGLVLDWYAPTLYSSHEAGVREWSEGDIVNLLRTGITSGHGTAHRDSTMGPMAEVVYGSLQYAGQGDLHAMATYLKSLPERVPSGRAVFAEVAPADVPGMLERGKRLYADRCARCHGDDGEGRAPAAPALAASRAASMRSPIDPVRIVLYGGFPPGTAGNPRPFGMPPFYQTFNNDDVASVLTYVRASWGNRASPVSPEDVERNRTGPLW